MNALERNPTTHNERRCALLHVTSTTAQHFSALTRVGSREELLDLFPKPFLLRPVLLRLCLQFRVRAFQLSRSPNRINEQSYKSESESLFDPPKEQFDHQADFCWDLHLVLGELIEI